VLYSKTSLLYYSNFSGLRSAIKTGAFITAINITKNMKVKYKSTILQSTSRTQVYITILGLSITTLELYGVIWDLRADFIINSLYSVVTNILM
jgi:hypothetical protein